MIFRIRKLFNQYLEQIVTAIPLVVLISLVIYPLIYLFRLSLSEYGTYVQKFVGLKNYIDLFTSSDFHQYTINSSLYSLTTVSISFLLGFTFALVLDKVTTRRLRWVYMALLLLAWALPRSVVGLVWRWIFHEDFGVINTVLVQLGLISDNIGWLGSRNLAWLSAITADSWARFPFFTLVLYAGLQTIPPQLYEAGRIDGAKVIELFRHITLPLMKGPILVTLLLQTLFAFRTFTLLFTLTGGGPGDSTTTLAIYLYKQGMIRLHFGYSSAIAIALLAFCMLIAFIYSKFLQAETLSSGQ